MTRTVARALVTASLAAGLVIGVPGQALAAKTYKNCTALNKVYPHGVGKPHAHDHVSSGYPVTNFKHSKALYNANSSKDRDHDGVACEKH